VPAVVQALAGFVLLGLMLARLARIQAPVFVVDRPLPPHCALGRVTLRGRLLGHSVRCHTREVFASPGPRPFQPVTLSADGRWLLVGANTRRARVSLVDGTAEISTRPH